MDAQKYLKIAIVGVICIVVLVVGYGIYINDASRRHIEKMAAAQYTVLPVARAEYRDVHATVGGIDVTARAAWTIDVTAEYEGVLNDIYVTKSQRVAEGDLLAVMRNTDLMAQVASAEADIEAARAQFINAEQTVNRYRYLVENNAISMQEYDSAVAQRDASRAQMESRMAKRDLVLSEQSKMTIAAPRAANIIQVYHEAGKYVRAGEPIVMLADLGELSARSVIPHEKLLQLTAFGKQFILDVQPHRLMHKAYPLNETMPKSDLKLNQFHMTLSQIIPDISVKSAFYDVVWQVENPTGILEPTYYEDVKIISKETMRKLVVPNHAIHRDAKTGNSFVFSLDEDSKLVQRTVTCGVSGGDVTEITEGLSEGEPVVVADPSIYSAGMKVGAKEYEF